MASLGQATTIKNELINDIKMDHFSYSSDRLGTTGVNSCVGFVVFLNNNQNVFIEHRTDVYFPEELSLENIRLCFENVATHIFKVLPESHVTGAFILGGIGNESRFQILQEKINEMIQAGVNINAEYKSHHYQQLLNNIRCNDVCFNKAAGSEELEKITGAPSLDLVVDRCLEDGERLMFVIQRVKKFAISDILVGVFVIGIQSNNRWFVIDQDAIKNTQIKSPKELEYLIEVVENFKSRATALGGVEVEGEMALHWLSYGQSIVTQTMVDRKKKQKKLKKRDRLIFKLSASTNDHEDHQHDAGNDDDSDDDTDDGDDGTDESDDDNF